MPTETRDLLITGTETNSHHGVGILLQRFFPQSADFVCLRTTSLYRGEEPFGSAHHELCSRTLTLTETEHHLRQILVLYKIRRILCVPYYREEFVHAVLAKKLTGAPLCTYLMDDQNVYAPHVPDHWVADLLGASDLCLGISPEMGAAYGKKYGRAVHLLPPLLDQAVPLVPGYWESDSREPVRAAMIGNVWTARRFTRLRELLRSTGLHVDWYGNGAQASWLPGTPEEWEADHIHGMGFYPEEDLIAALASYPFVLVPSGTLDDDDDNPAFSRLSLPSRLLFVHARTDTPVLVLGSPETAAGRFVTHFQTGVCASYEPGEFQSQLTRLLDPKLRADLRANVRRWAPALVQPDTGDWLWRSLAAGQPAPAGFQRMFPPDYLGPTAALERIEPARPRPLRHFPVPGENFRDAQAESFGFFRRRHLPVFTASGLSVPGLEELDLTLLNATAAHFILRGALPAGGDVLFLGPEIPDLLKTLHPAYRLWRIVDVAAWQRAGYAGDPSHVVAVANGTPHPPVFPQFAAIVSTHWCGQLNDDPHALEGLSLFLDGCTKPGGINLHFFSAVLHPTYFWCGPAHAYLRRRFLSGTSWPDLDELLGATDLFTMSEAAYDRHWKPATGKSYAALGKPLTLSLYWRKSAGT